MTTEVAAERVYQENLEKAKREIERRTGKTPAQLYDEREKRVRDAIQLKEPDRIPALPRMTYFPAHYTGILRSTAYYDALAWKMAVVKTMVDFEPDLFSLSSGSNSGLVLETLDPKHSKWPGGTLPPEVAHQAIEREYMKEDEYDLFLSDPTDFTLRYLLPRAFGALAPLAELPCLTDRFTGFPAMTTVFTRHDMQQTARALLKAGQEQGKWLHTMSTLPDEMAALGFPPHSHGGGAGGAPFDAISDYYRGMRGAMIDMFKQPEKLLAACDKILEWRIKRAVPADPHQRGNPKRIFIPLHRGADGFMSKKQFEIFYWPGLKKALLTSIDLGFVPMPFIEGGFNNRLEYLLELPKGKVVAHFDQTDIFRAKEILGGHICIMGNVPSALLQVGSPQETEEYCKKLIKVCGKGGGFILTNGCEIDEAKPANVRAMVESCKKYKP